jgi:hypothetical protein
MQQRFHEHVEAKESKLEEPEPRRPEDGGDGNDVVDVLVRQEVRFFKIIYLVIHLFGVMSFDDSSMNRN